MMMGAFRTMRLCSAALVMASISLPVCAQQASSDHIDNPADTYASRVTIVRDSFGIAHVHGRTDAEAVFGMIYAQAEDDFPRIEHNYLVALGRLAEAEGEGALWQDLRQRLFLDPEDLKRQYRESPEWLKALLDGWAADLNHYLATHPDVKPRVLTQFEPWMPLAFSEGSIGGDFERGVDLPELQAFYDRTEPSPIALANGDPWQMVEPKGSNGIAIAPSRSVDGHALLWINPHTSFFFRAEQQVTSDEGLDVYGAATWGQFFIYQGFNRHAGWMHTSTGVDNIDEFAETVTEQNGHLVYRYGNAWRPVNQRMVRLMVRQANSGLTERSFNVLSTHHGPIIRADGDKWIAIALLNQPRAALEQSFLRTKQHDLAGYLQVSDRKANSSNNTIFADDKGAIAYLHPQFVPVRDPRFDYTHPVDGSDPATDWKGLHSLDELPEVVSPASGFVYNTNNWPWSAAGPDSPKAQDFPHYMDVFGENPRGLHVLRLMQDNPTFTAQSLTRAAFDSFLPLFDAQIPRLQDGFDNLPAADPRRTLLAEPVSMLAGWDRRWGVDSQPMALAAHWGEALWQAEGPKAAAADMPLFGYLDTRTTNEDRLEALETAIAAMNAKFGTWRIAWGRINRFQRLNGAIASIFDDSQPSLPVGFTSGNFGSLAAFGVERPSGQNCFYGTSGNSFVAVVEFGPEIKAWAVSAGGESGDPRSQHFDDQVVRYATGDLRPILLSEEALRPFARQAYHPGESRPEPHNRKPVAGESLCGEP